MSQEERVKYSTKLGWISKFKNRIKEWKSIMKMLSITKNEIKNKGLSNDIFLNFKNSISKIHVFTDRLLQLKIDLINFVESESKGVIDNQKLLGCSDIIESVFGKYKNFSSKSPMKEVGRAILTMPVFTSQITLENVKEAMLNVSSNDVNNWLSENIGETLFSRRKQMFNLNSRKTG